MTTHGSFISRGGPSPRSRSLHCARASSLAPFRSRFSFRLSCGVPCSAPALSIALALRRSLPSVRAFHFVFVAGVPRPAPALSIALALRRSLHSVRAFHFVLVAGVPRPLPLSRRTPLVFQLRDRLFEDPPALRVVLEHVEARARRREDDRVARRGERERGAHRRSHVWCIVHGNSGCERLVHEGRGFSYRDNGGAAFRQSGAQIAEVSALETAPQD